MAETPRAYQLPEHFVHLGDAGAATPLEVTESFWSDLTGGRFGALGPGRLVSFYHFTEDWDVWERHPAGDEFVCLFSGKMELVLDRPSGEQRVTLSRPGAFLLVPRGAWHTASVLEPSAGLFVTAGEGTEHRPR